MNNTTQEQILSLQQKIAEKHGSNDKLDSWLVRQWEAEVGKLRDEIENTKPKTEY